MQSLSEEKQKQFLNDPFKFWSPPQKIETILTCPFCRNKIVLKTVYTVDSFSENREWDETLHNFYPSVAKRMIGAKIVNTRIFVESQRWRQFFASCLFLRESELQSLVSSFVVWCNPLVTDIEQEITKLISEQAWKEIFKAGLKNNVEDEDHTSQMG